MGFEPMNGFKTVNRLAGGPNRPLWHLPMFILEGYLLIICNYSGTANY